MKELAIEKIHAEKGRAECHYVPAGQTYTAGTLATIDECVKLQNVNIK